MAYAEITPVERSASPPAVEIGEFAVDKPVSSPTSRVQHLIWTSLDKIAQFQETQPLAPQNPSSTTAQQHNRPCPGLTGARRKKVIWIGLIIIFLFFIAVGGVLADLFASESSGGDSSSSGSSTGDDGMGADKNNLVASRSSGSGDDYQAEYKVLYGDVYDEDFGNRSYLLTSAAGCKNRSEVTAWNCRFCEMIGDSFIIYQEMNYNYTHSFVGYDQEYGNIVLAFAGIKNSDNRQKSVRCQLTDYYHMNGEAVPDAQVHRGWYGYWQSFGEDVLEAITRVMDDYPDAPVLFAGYSMGSALVSFAALDFGEYLTDNGYDIPVSIVMTFGSPRWGNEVMADYFDDNVESTWRVVNMFDAVPLVPPTLQEGGYSHTKNEIWYSCTKDRDTGETRYRQCVEDDPTCKYTLWVSAINDHMYYYHVYSACSLYTSKGVRKGESHPTPCHDDDEWLEEVDVDIDIDAPSGSTASVQVFEGIPID